jgi:hypothetical protein
MRKGRLRSAIVLVAVGAACAIGFSGLALAAGLNPQLRSPGHNKAVTAGHAKLKVYVPDPASAINGKIFLTISDKRIVKGGVLKWSKHCGFRCDIATMKRVGHSNVYRYVDPFNFPGNWQDTPGKYYWQAFYYPSGGVGTLDSAVGSFRIVG